MIQPMPLPRNGNDCDVRQRLEVGDEDDDVKGKAGRVGERLHAGITAAVADEERLTTISLVVELCTNSRMT